MLNDCDCTSLNSLTCASTVAYSVVNSSPCAQSHEPLWPVICFLSGKSFRASWWDCGQLLLWAQEKEAFVSCVALVESPVLFCICILQIRNVFSRPRVVKGTNNKQQSNGITFHGGCTVYCMFFWGLIRLALSQVKAHPLLLFGITNDYIGHNIFKPTWGFSHLKNSDLRNIKWNVDLLNITWHQCWYFPLAFGIPFHLLGLFLLHVSR